jgi:hypothetical protein
MLDVYGSLGSAQSSKCAGSAIVPANYMSGGAPPAPLTGGGEASKGLSTGAKVALTLGIVVAGVAVYSMASGIGATLAANPRARRLSQFEELQRSLTRQWTRAKTLADVEPLVRAAGKPGGRPVVFLVSSRESQKPTEHMIAQILPGSEFVHSSLSYAGILAHAKTLNGHPLVFYDAQDLKSGLFALVELRKQDPNQPILAVGHAESTLPTLIGRPAAYSSADEQIVKQAAAALNARLVVQEDGRWVEYTPGLVSNPNYSARRQGIEKILGNAGWSFRLADNELRADGAARGLNGRLYLLSSDEGGSPRDPKDPVHVGVYALSTAKDEWIEVGDETFPDLRSALTGWQGIEIDVNTVQSLSGGNFNPGYADNDSYSPFHERLPGGKAAGMRPSDFDPETLARGTKHELEHTRDRAVAQEIAMDHLAGEGPDYYEKLDAMERRSFRDNPKLQWQGSGSGAWARGANYTYYRLLQRAPGEWLVYFDDSSAFGYGAAIGAERTPALAKRLAQTHANDLTRRDNCGCSA